MTAESLKTENEFRDFLTKSELIPPNKIISDGKIHRCDVDCGPHGKGDGAYMLIVHGPEFAVGGCMNWRDGEGWRQWKSGRYKDLDEQERHRIKQKIMRAKAEQELEQYRREKQCVSKAQGMWGFARPGDGHPYLVAKAIAAHGTRQLDGLLLIPVRDVRGTWHGMQCIDADGTKKYLTGSRTMACYYGFGQANGILCIAEGFATAASIHEATGYPVAAAFDAGNLLMVATVMRRFHPAAKIVMCADDDPRQKNGKPGVGIPKATAAAKSIGGYLAIPDFGLDKRPEYTDFNDMARIVGPWAVKSQVDNAVKVDADQ